MSYNESRSVKTILRILTYLRKYIWRAVAAHLSLLLSTVLGLAIPWLIKEVIDRGLGDREASFMVLAAMAVVAVSVAKGLFAFGEGYLFESVSQRVSFDLRNALYDRIQRLSFSFHDRSQTGDLMSRTTYDVDSVRLFLNMGLMNAFNTTFTVFAISAVLISINWRLALVSLALMPVLGLRAVVVARRLRKLYMRVQRQFAAMSTVLQENIAGVRVVKAFAREKHEIDKFSRENRQLMFDHLAAIHQWAFNFPFMSFLVTLAAALILWYGGRETIAGRLTIGELVAFNGYLVMLAWPVRTLGWVMNLTARAISSGERIFEILDAPSEVQEVPHAITMPPLRGHIRFEGVSFGYDPQNLILRDVSFEARPGEVIALVGRTGAGKTSIVNLIPRFYDPTAGRITIDGLDLRQVSLSSLRRQIGIVLQESFLFSTSVRENIAYGVEDVSMEAIVAAAQAAHAHDFIMGLPQGYDTVVGERGITLSGGQRQRIAIARALLLNPPILILDDSTSSVDMETEYLIQEALSRLMRGRTTFVIAQRLTTVKRASQILVVEGGTIVERGTHQELLAKGRVYRKIYEMQLQEQEEAARLAAAAGVTNREGED
jgi:ATP-binding cassette subfamily B protein